MGGHGHAITCLATHEGMQAADRRSCIISSQKVHVDDDKDNVPMTSGGVGKGGKVNKAFDREEPEVADGIERQVASVSGIMSSSDFNSLNLTPNTQKVSLMDRQGSQVDPFAP